MESKYDFSVRGLYGQLSADDAMKELLRIRDKHDGVISPTLIVEESRPATAVLHGIFQWNNELAADAYREWQAAQLIRNIRVVVNEEEVSITTRAIVNVRTSESAQRSYTPITEAIHNEAAYDDLLKQAKADIEKFVAKYNQIEQLNGVKRAMLAFINGVE